MRARNNCLDEKCSSVEELKSFHLTFLLCCRLCFSGHQSGFCMICVMQNHIIQAYANTGNAIKPVSFIRDLKSKAPCLLMPIRLSCDVHGIVVSIENPSTWVCG